MEEKIHERVEHPEQIPAMIAILDYKNLKQYFPSDIFIPSHWHRSLEITLIENAEVYLRIKDHETKIENDFTCVNSGDVHSLRAGILQKDASCIILLISYDFIKQHVPDFDHIVFDLHKCEDHTPLKQIYYHLRDLYVNQDQFSYLLITACILEILQHLLANYQKPRYDIKHKSSRNEDQIKQILTYVHNHYQEEMTLQDMALNFHMSKEYFSRQFHQNVGKTFLDYLSNYRLYKAYDDVIQSDMTIQDIARKHGFYNVRSFIKIFHEAYHETPLQYRKKMSIK